MQATSSQVSPLGALAQTVFAAPTFNDEPAAIIPLELKKAAQASGRDHLLVRRRRRDGRRATR